MAKINSKPQRVDPELTKIMQQVKAEYLMKGKDLSYRRISLAMARQYKNDPLKMKELKENIGK